MTSTRGLISQETIDEINLMHELSTIKDKLEASVAYQDPVALTPKEAQVLLDNRVMNY